MQHQVVVDNPDGDYVHIYRRTRLSNHPPADIKMSLDVPKALTSTMHTIISQYCASVMERLVDSYDGGYINVDGKIYDVCLFLLVKL